MPTRLLFIEPGGCHDTLNIKLIEGAKAHKQYAALSHCWGSNQPLRTVRENLTQFNKSIPWPDLPQTFQDAVTVANSLGISYLWIDSLCILQDDFLDWERESSQMANIYENAVVTIVAASSAGDSDGFLHPRPEIPQGTVMLQPKKPGLDATPVRFRGRLDHYDDSRLQDPLEQRAWAFQERLLSRRTLLYSTHELRWECNQLRLCECRHNSLTSRANSSHPYAIEPSLSAPPTRTDIYAHWHLQIAKRYAKRKLTKPEDKLPALSGVAHRMSRLLDDQYIAGLWRNDLFGGMLWQTETNSPPLSKPRSYRAPSFAWASVDDAITYHLYTLMKYINQSSEILEVFCQPAGLDPFGQVEKGHMVLQGPLVSARD
ncbi:hypothetical protein LSUE1_G006943 [Lachnellula suecica]|uniref:Heterokaryon incompatibility domain-containing protein n=1 Tax=Lachnellula suecica TaxID=602035 RepID=A0A8T9CF19_9HELO|nr:hypothetical protein LSUE1_G006943 [Lachnellula suecica]